MRNQENLSKRIFEVKNQNQNLRYQLDQKDLQIEKLTLEVENLKLIGISIQLITYIHKTN